MTDENRSSAPVAGGTPFDLLEPKTIAFYLRALDILSASGFRFAVGGAYALAYYAGIVRHTKDLDIFARRKDAPSIIKAFDAAGHRTDWTHPHWIAKAFSADGEDFIDVIYGSGNGLTAVDDDWLDHSVDGEILGRPVKVCPAEEILWSKSFIQERDRFDGADVAHLLLARIDQLDWDRLLSRFRRHEGVLLSHLFLFGYIYPTHRNRVPGRVMQTLLERERSAPAPAEKICRGPLLSYSQYLPDIRDRGYVDARLTLGTMTPAEIERWTNAPK